MSEQNRVFELIGRLAWDRFEQVNQAGQKLAELGESNRRLMAVVDKLKAELEELRKKNGD